MRSLIFNRDRCFLYCHTAENDVSIASTEIDIPEVLPQDVLQTSSVEMLFRPDGIAQESNETFILNFTFEAGAFGDNATLHNSLEGTVIDADSKINHEQFL